MTKQYELLDSGNFKKLERVGPYRVVRPSPSAVWAPSLGSGEWEKVDALFNRYEDGDGEWKIFNKKINEPWSIQVENIHFQLKLTSFGHLGIFPEQYESWLELKKIVEKRSGEKRPTHVLNLFAYTGGSSLFCAAAGAEVTHVDASKGSVNWARENALASGLEKRPIRWLVDDVQEFVAREIRRGSKYHGIILDPPSYGRGGKNQIWKIEEHLLPHLGNLRKLMADDFSFVLLSSHSPGYTPMSLKNLLLPFGGPRNSSSGEGHLSRENNDSASSSGEFIAREMLIPEKSGRFLPSGTSCLFLAHK